MGIYQIRYKMHILINIIFIFSKIFGNCIFCQILTIFLIVEHQNIFYKQNITPFGLKPKSIGYFFLVMKIKEYYYPIFYNKYNYITR